MRTTRRRPTVRALTLAAAVACAVVGLVGAPRATALPGTVAVKAAPAAGTAKEPLSDADKDLLVKVRLAGLWEEPAGKMAARKGVNPRVREIGSMIASQHVQLDALVVKAANQVGVELPNEPNADQQKWLGEMQAAEGEQFDQVFVDRLRAAHGKVFPAIANVRSSTQNTVVRKLAQSANGFVLTHLTLLESTSLVDYASLPAAAAAAAPAPTPQGSSGLAAVTGSVTSLVSSPPAYAGLILPIAVLLIVPRLMRWGVRRRLAVRNGPDRDLPPPSSRREAPQERAVRMPSPYDAFAPSPPDPYVDPYGDPVHSASSRRLRTAPRIRP